MKKQLLILSLFSTLFFFGCFSPKPIYQMDLDELSFEKFEPLELNPDFDLYSLRFDLIRQTEEDCTEDSDGCESCSEEDVAYGILGFRLGNGLFYDLNGNLSLNIPELFGLDKLENFEIRNISSKRPVEYIKTSEGFRMNYSTFFRNRSFFQKIEEDESGNVSVSYKRFLWKKLSIFKEDDNLNMKAKFLKCSIKKTEKGYSFEKSPFFREGNELFLGRNYVLRENPESIEILSFRKNPEKRRVLYTLKKTKDGVIFYDSFYQGSQLIRKGNDILSFEINKIPMEAYKLVQR